MDLIRDGEKGNEAIGFDGGAVRRRLEVRRNRKSHSTLD